MKYLKPADTHVWGLRVIRVYPNGLDGKPPRMDFLTRCHKIAGIIMLSIVLLLGVLLILGIVITVLVLLV